VRTRSVFGLAAFLLIGMMAFAQSPKYEVALNYSFLHYNPAKSFSGSEDLHGGGGSFVRNFGKNVGIKAEFTGYASVQQTFHLVAKPPTVPVTSSFTTQANLFTYLFGPQVNLPVRGMRVFGQALFGGANTNGYAHLFKAAGITGVSAGNSGFAMAFGGGLDLPVAKHVMIRPVQVDYLLTRYEYKAIGINNQSNFRYQAGIVFAFGGE
jgi:hypothetical protein